MVSEAKNLADELAALRAAVAERDAKIEALIHANKALRDQNGELRKDLTTLRREVQRLLKARSGVQTIAEGLAQLP